MGADEQGCYRDASVSIGGQFFMQLGKFLAVNAKNARNRFDL